MQQEHIPRLRVQIHHCIVFFVAREGIPPYWGLILLVHVALVRKVNINRVLAQTVNQIVRCAQLDFSRPLLIQALLNPASSAERDHILLDLD